MVQGEREKVEVLLGMLHAAPVDSWLLWADFDTVFSGRTFGLPLAQYEDEQRHLVLSGQLDQILAGDGYSECTSHCNHLHRIASHVVEACLAVVEENLTMLYVTALSSYKALLQG